MLLEAEQDGDDERLSEYRSDVAVIESGRPLGGASLGVSASAGTIEPILIRRQHEPAIDRFVQIIDVTNGNRVVTAIDFLSPWNKAAGRLNRDYLRKLRDYARGSVSVVEIDLLRYPPRGRLPVTENDIPPNRRTAYLACVRRAWEPDTWRAYPMPLRSPLPRIPIPLRQRDEEVGLELQPLITRVYTAGGHDDIDYTKPPDPPLDADDAAWAQEVTADPPQT